MFQLIGWTTVLLACEFAVGLAAAQGSPADGRIIREVRIHIATIYPEEEAADSETASFANRFHITTRESVIRTHLLFTEGDVLDEELLQSSERALRRLKFLNSAEVSIVPVDEQTVDVEVRTRDAWSLEPGLNIEGGGDLYTVSLHLIEFNLLGFGKKLFVEAIDESDVGTTMKFGYSDYQLFNSRAIGNLRYKNGPLVESFYAQGSMPLYSPDSKWSYGGSAFTSNSIIRTFEEGEEVSRVGKDTDRLGGFLKRSFGPRFNKTNLTLSLQYKKVDYSELGDETTIEPPPDEANLTPSVKVNTSASRWVETSYINKMGITEDTWLGHTYGGKVGYGIPVENGFELWDTQAFIGGNYAFSNKQLLKVKASISSQIVRNTIFLLSAKYYKQFSRHTVATRFITKVGNDLVSTMQFRLGGDSGLRGYPARQFTGDKLVLINLEDRQFWGDYSFGPKFGLGTVVFVDAGNVWAPDDDIDLNDLNWSAGVGIRMSMINMPHQPILRLDYAWAIGNEFDSALTIGLEQQF